MLNTTAMDTEGLLLPISPFDSPAGSSANTTASDPRHDISVDSLYQRLKFARNAARAAERSQLFSEPGPDSSGHWRTVVELTPVFFATVAKDLEVACWYTEALLREQGLSGLSCGFRLILGLLDQYWESLYPLPDEDGLETRIAPLAGLNGEGTEGVLIAPVRNTLITQGRTLGPFSYWDYYQANEAARIPDEKGRLARISKLGYSLESVEQAARESDTGFYVGIRNDLENCLTLFSEIGRRLTEYCGPLDAPPTRNVLNVLEECLAAVTVLGGDRFPTAPTPLSEPLPEEVCDPQMATPPPLACAREQALQQILVLADYFRRTEPHSPLSYLLAKAAAWGDLPLHELMKELITDPASLKHYSAMTGLNDCCADA